MNRWLPMIAILLMCASVSAVVVLAGRSFVWRPAPAPAAAPASRGSGEPLEVVMGTRWSPVEGYQRTRSFAECLERETGRPVTVLQRSTYAEVNALVATGRGEISLVCSGATADPRLRATTEAAWRLDAGGDGTYHAVIVVREEDPAASLGDLAGATVTWTDPDSLTGYCAPRAALRALGHEPDAWLGAMSFSHSHDASLDAVVQGFVRVAAVDEEVLRARGPAGVKVIWRSDPFPAPPVLIRRGDEAVGAALARIAGRPECLADLGATRLLPTRWSDYDALASVISGGR